MKQYFSDLHIHIGRAKGLPVKITGAQNLTFKNIVEESITRKGLDIIGIIDSGSPLVLQEINEMLEKGELEELRDGGLLYKDKITVILGSEVETIEDGGGRAHSLCYFPYLEQMRIFSKEMTHYIKNINLSSQLCYMNARTLLSIVEKIGGILIPAHAFTPHKSFYGSVCNRLSEIFPEDMFKKIPAIELGLSADSDFASRIFELKEKAFLSNSDAHSLSKIAREYNIFRMKSPTFRELVLAMKRENGREIKANYGLDPRLGKYHRTRCMECSYVSKEEPPVLICPKCGGENVVLGVLDRITIIQDSPDGLPERKNSYFYQIPLEFIPNIGPKTIRILLDNFGSEMNILHKVSERELEKVLGRSLAEKIVYAREGKLDIIPGGGGIYGKISI